MENRELIASLEELRSNLVAFSQSRSYGVINLMRKVLRRQVRKDGLTHSLDLLEQLINKSNQQEIIPHGERSGTLELELKAATELIDSMSKKVTELYERFEWGRKVDLVNLDPLAIFMFIDDLGYKNYPENIKKYPISAHVQKLTSRKTFPTGSNESPEYKLNKHGIKYLLLDHYWSHNLPFTFFCVGCQYGISELRVANFIKAHQQKNRVICFDPGLAGRLVPYNIEINRLNDIVTFEPLAVTNHSLPCIIFSEIGNTQNNRMVNREPGSEVKSWVSRSISIDEYVSRNNIADNLILIIDTQGGEYEVIEGMKSVIKSRCVSYIVEFTPWALRTRIEPIDFLSMIGTETYLFNLPEHNRPIREIKTDEYAEFVSEVDGYIGRWTDILVIPKKLPGVESLREEISRIAKVN